MIEEGHTSRNNEFCGSFFSYKIGKLAMVVCEEVVQRHAHDLLADGSLSAGVDVLQSAGVDTMSASSSVDDAVRWLRLLPVAGSKLSTALASWSRLRIDEMCDNVQGMLETMAGVIDHAAALATMKVHAMARPHMNAIDDSLSGTSATPARSGDVVDKVRALSKAAWACVAELWELKTELNNAIDGFNKMLVNILKQSKGQATLIEFGENLMSASQAPSTWMAMLWALLRGLQVLAPIVTRTDFATESVPLFPHCLDDYCKHSDAGSCALASGAPVAENLQEDIARSTPILKCIAYLCFGQRVVRGEPMMPEEFRERWAPCRRTPRSRSWSIGWSTAPSRP